MDEVVECSEEVGARKVGVHFRGVRGNSAQILCVREKRWRQPLPNSSQSVFYMQTVESSFWQNSVYRCETIKKSAWKELLRVILGFGPDNQSHSWCFSFIPAISISQSCTSFSKLLQTCQSFEAFMARSSDFEVYIHVLIHSRSSIILVLISDDGL